MTARIEFKLEDVWVGVFWRAEHFELTASTFYDVWVCIVPCLPIHIMWERKDYQS